MKSADTSSLACIIHVVRVSQEQGIKDAAVLLSSKFLITKLLWCYGGAVGEKVKVFVMIVCTIRDRN